MDGPSRSLQAQWTEAKISQGDANGQLKGPYEQGWDALNPAAPKLVFSLKETQKQFPLKPLSWY